MWYQDFGNYISSFTESRTMDPLVSSDREKYLPFLWIYGTTLLRNQKF